MGNLAKLIKQAAPETDEETSAFLDRLNKLEGEAAVPSTGAEDLKYMTEEMGLPTTKDEMWRNTIKMLANVGVGASNIGKLLRAMRARGEERAREEMFSNIGAFEGDVPGRGVTVPLGSKAASLGAIGALAALSPSNIKQKGKDLKEHLFAQTGKATDNPWLYPLMVATALGSGYQGYSGLDEEIKAMRKERASRAIAEAKQEFEDAMAAQLEESRLAEEAGIKTSAQKLGIAVDVLARAHASGELYEQLESFDKRALDEEPADEPWTLGAGNKAIGLYMALLAALATAGGVAGYHGVKAHETPRRKHEVAKELLRRRSMSTPPIVTTEA